MVELSRWCAALSLPGGAAAVREVLRVSRLWATEGGLDFIREDVCGLGHPTPLPTAAGKDTVKADQGGEEMPDGHPDCDQGAIWNVRSLGLQPFKAFGDITMAITICRHLYETFASLILIQH